MARPPCYDVVNHKDCPDRQWCKEVGRSKCKKWTDYEKEHAIEMQARRKEAERRSAICENSERIRRMTSRHNRYK